MAKQKTKKSKKPIFCCEWCGKGIFKGEKYYIEDGAIAHAETEKGKVSETKENVWALRLLCMGCYSRKSRNKTRDIIEHHYRRR